MPNYSTASRPDQPPSSRLVDSIQEQVEGAITRINDLTQLIQNHCDNVLGSIPTGGAALNKSSEPPPGRLYQLRDTVGNVHRAIDDLHEQIKRLDYI